jgi:mono/diheme cytochrome c family protein
MQKAPAKVGIQRFSLCVLLALLFAVAWPAASQTSASQEGKKIFADKCANCHSEDGSGNTAIGQALKAADLRSPTTKKKTDAELYQQIEKGKGNMPPFGSSLNKEQINDLIAYLRELGKVQPSGKKAH